MKSIEFPVSVIFFGRTGEGKSTLANMLIQKDLSRENKFKISNGATGETSKIKCAHNNMFVVYDTIGLCETTKGTSPHKDALKQIRNYFAQVHEPLHYICYVKKQGRFTNEDKKTFAEFQKIFRGGEDNFVIIITDSSQRWVEDNAQVIREYFGNRYIIAVNFPFDEYQDDDRDQATREINKIQLVETLLKLKYNGVKLEVIESSSKTESKVANIITFVPVVGVAYDLISSGVYLVLKKPHLARRRFIKGLFGGVEAFARIIAAHDPSLTQTIQRLLE